MREGQIVIYLGEKGPVGFMAPTGQGVRIGVFKKQGGAARGSFVSDNENKTLNQRHPAWRSVLQGVKGFRARNRN
jgi:hypothetical protein